MWFSVLSMETQRVKFVHDMTRQIKTNVSTLFCVALTFRRGQFWHQCGGGASNLKFRLMQTMSNTGSSNLI